MKPYVVCLTPVKNEAWILDRFLQCASLWADHIIIADQQSTDGSRQIASSYSKVSLIDNLCKPFNEPERQQMLLQRARQFPEPRLIITLDADEFLTADFQTSPEWQTVLQSSPGTVIEFQWANILPTLRDCWLVGDRPLGFMDDGTLHAGTDIHSPRIPLPSCAPVIKLRTVKVLHFQYTDWARMESKHRWYQCWERLNHPQRRAIDVYRQYHHMYAIPEDAIEPMPREWLAGYESRGIDMTTVRSEPFYWWDREVLDWFNRFGTARFRREAVWDIDWVALANRMDTQFDSTRIRDPRNRFEKSVHRWLRKTQPSANRRDVRLVQRGLRLVGW